ncbi:unnamed protein product [Mucor hiemalis]
MSETGGTEVNDTGEEAAIEVVSATCEWVGLELGKADEHVFDSNEKADLRDSAGRLIVWFQKASLQMP